MSRLRTDGIFHEDAKRRRRVKEIGEAMKKSSGGNGTGTKGYEKDGNEEARKEARKSRKEGSVR